MCKLQNQSISLNCMLARLSVALAARNNFLLVTVTVFVHAPCNVRSATLLFCMPDILYFTCSTFLSLLFLGAYLVVLYKETEKFSCFLVEASTDSCCTPDASLVSSVGRVVAPLTGWYWVRIPVGLALHVISPHPRVCKL